MRRTKTLTAVAVARMTDPGRYAVGDGAYLQIATGGTKSWVFRYQRDGKARHMGLGPFDLVTLAEAREKAREARRLLLDGADPLEAKAAKRRQASLAAAQSVTFKHTEIISGTMIQLGLTKWKKEYGAAISLISQIT